MQDGKPETKTQRKRRSRMTTRRMRALEMYDDGMTQQQVADELGVTRQAVGNWIKEARAEIDDEWRGAYIKRQVHKREGQMGIIGERAFEPTADKPSPDDPDHDMADTATWRELMAAGDKLAASIDRLLGIGKLPPDVADTPGYSPESEAWMAEQEERNGEVE